MDTSGYIRIQCIEVSWPEYRGSHRIRSGYAQDTQDTSRIQYPEGYTQDTSGYIRIRQDTVLRENTPSLKRKHPHQTRHTEELGNRLRVRHDSQRTWQVSSEKLPVVTSATSSSEPAPLLLGPAHRASAFSSSSGAAQGLTRDRSVEMNQTLMCRGSRSDARGVRAAAGCVSCSRQRARVVADASGAASVLDA